jgi:hypothetical protein
MPNTRIQIRRSSATATPTNGSLQAGELAYSYNSDRLFVGDAAGTGVVEIGGKYYLDLINVSFTQANTTNAYLIGVISNASAGANAYATAVGAGSNAYATAVGAGANSYMIAVQNGSNTAIGAGANAYATAVGAGSNNYLLAVIAGANTAVGAGANAYALSISTGSGSGANNYANSTFVKLVSGYQTITGNLAVTGSITVSGNAFSIDTQTLRVSDPLIYLAGNNYTSDIVDIGFVGNYVNATGSNVHTGVFRDATTKEYYVFEGYDQEPNPNHINTSGNNFTLAVLNATIKTSNLILGGANAITTINSVGVAANAFASATIAGANTAVGAGANAYAATVGTGANNYLLAVIAGANTAVGAGANAYATAVGAGANAYMIAVQNGSNTAVGAGANAYAAVVGAAANTNASNASYLSIGTVPSARISGSYTGITGVGTITAGIWNGSTVTVPYGGTGMTSFTSNGILYGNNAGDLKVTGAGTEGQVLQASSTGIPSFAMLDGGTF